MKPSILYLLLLFLLFTACQKENLSSLEDHEEKKMTGGETTIFSSGPDAFSFPLANLNQDGLDLHFQADAAFSQHYVSAPATQFGGVGPLFNQNSCESCHIRNGRGIIPQFDGDQSTGLLLRLSMPGVGDNNGILPVPGFGGQLQTKAIFGVRPEGKISRVETEEIRRFVDGSKVTLTKPVYTVKDPYMPVPADMMVSPRIAPPVHGLGLLEAIPEADIIAVADIDDLNNDGISGKVNKVWDIKKGGFSIGRFGWKAEQPTAAQQSADAAHHDMGLTSSFFPVEHCLDQENCQTGLQDHYDLDDENNNVLAFYFQTLAVPARRNMDDPSVNRGEKLFEKANCSSCHTPKQVTGPHPTKALAHQTIYPFTDMLLHDMGEGLADHRPSYDATGSEWRTPPLWGVGLTQVVNAKANFLHDGRAKTLEEAILWHGGEAQGARTYYQNLSQEARNDLIAFVKSL